MFQHYILLGKEADIMYMSCLISVDLGMHNAFDTLRYTACFSSSHKLSGLLYFFLVGCALLGGFCFIFCAFLFEKTMPHKAHNAYLLSLLSELKVTFAKLQLHLLTFKVI